jgi:hypothetical protein
MIPLKVYLLGGAVVAVLLAGWVLYSGVYNKGFTASEQLQEKKLNTIKEKTNAAKTDALTADPSDVDKRLRDKYRRED